MHTVTEQVEFMEPTAGETSRSDDVGMNFRAYLQVALLDSTQHGLTSESSRSSHNVDCHSLDLKPLRNRGCDVQCLPCTITYAYAYNHHNRT